MTFLRQLLAFALLFAGAGAALGANPAAAHYSFMDVYRFAVIGEAADYPLGFGAAAPLPAQFAPAQFPQSPDYQVRVASVEAQPAVPLFSVVAPQLNSAGFVYSGSALPAPSRWLLILSGLALAAWVARRRLGYSL